MKKLTIVLIILGIGLFVVGLLYFYHKPSLKEKKLVVQEKKEEVLPLKTKHEESPEVKSKAIIVKQEGNQVSSLEEEKKIEGLINQVKSEDILVSKDAADKLVKLGKPAVPGLLRVLKGADVGLKGQIIFILGRIGDKEATPELIETLGDENAYIRRNSAEALGKIEDQEAMPNLATALFDDDASVRARSAWALGELQDSAAVTSLLDRLKDEKEEMVKSEILDSLRQLNDPTATPELVNELNSRSDLIYKNKVVICLGEIGDSRAIPDLTEHLNQLKQYEPEDPLIKFQHDEALSIAEDAIEKIQKR